VEVEFQHGDRFSARWGLPPAFRPLFDDIYKYRMAADDLCGFDLTAGEMVTSSFRKRQRKKWRRLDLWG